MEALLEKEGNVENWNDDRLDELSRRVDNGFKEMREGFARVDVRFAQVDAKIDRIGGRIDKLFYIQIVFMGSLAVGLLTKVI
ncbi:MAG: hypothetical protein ACTHN3_14505 [Solirubrobacterales bacterium]